MKTTACLIYLFHDCRIQVTQNSLWPIHLRTRGISRTLSNIYSGAFYPEPRATPAYSGPDKYLEYCQASMIQHISEPCVTLAYLEPWYIQNPVKHLLCSIFFRLLCHPDIFRILVYPEPWHILKPSYILNFQIYQMKYFVQNPLCL